MIGLGVWLLAIGAIAALYMLLGCAILVWSDPRKGEPTDGGLEGRQAALVVVGWLPLLILALVTGGRR